ncbi:MAG: 4-hydroxy-3-methylbut-2-enyl diphosphate reductase [Lentisphaerae bacterium]|nr:4-hydroxy-3-methylbut-2-enyl diphosphate reductase [Lentisphaerota bacterium]
MRTGLHRAIVVANPHGFCAGVRRAVALLEAALRDSDGPVYCLNEIVHNRQVVERLGGRGVRFVRDPREVPRGARVVFSAHGVAPAVREAARRRGLRVVDATCPFVSKLHAEVRAYASAGYTVLLIGHHGHDEIVGIQGEAPANVVVIANAAEARSVRVPDRARLAVVTQTTLNIDEAERVMRVLRGRFPRLETPPTKGICRATINRQEAAKLLAGRAGLILVLGSRNSSNTRRLVEVAEAAGARACLVDAPEALPDAELRAAGTIGITAGASTPEEFVAAVVAELRQRGFDRVERVAGPEERMRFPVPDALRRAAKRR